MTRAALSMPPHMLISAHPRYAASILSGEKTVEFRRAFPSAGNMAGVVVWIYATSPVKAVTAAARIREVVQLPIDRLWRAYRRQGAIDEASFRTYFEGKAHGCAIELSGVKKLSDDVPYEALRSSGFHVPQSYRYVTGQVRRILEGACGDAPA